MNRDQRRHLGMAFALCVFCFAVPPAVHAEDDSQTRFAQLEQAAWKEVLHDPCTQDWRTNWTLDGQRATVSNGERGMDFAAGLTFGDDACHAVLWTKQSFAGDIRIDYEYTRLDRETRCVTILYVEATGSGVGEYGKDISAWSDLRTTPSMRTYFNNMNTYHISYAAFDNKNTDTTSDYIRARRYLPLAQQGLKETDLQPDYSETGLFQTGVPHRITVIKHGDELFMQIHGSGKTMLCHWRTDSFPPILEGRIGLRHMYTRRARYRDFRVSVPGSRADSVE